MIKTARIHRNADKLAEFTAPRCPKCNSDQMAIEDTMRGGTASDGKPLVWFRCATCRSLAMAWPDA